VIKARVISQAGVRELIRVTDAAGVEFLPLNIPQQTSLEKTLATLLADGDNKCGLLPDLLIEFLAIINSSVLAHGLPPNYPIWCLRIQGKSRSTESSILSAG
jgi:hypothetical protein